MVTIIFESHGTTLDNEMHLSSGLYDVELSELGRQQAKELGERYKDEEFDAIFCSDLKRSYDTAEIAFEGRDLLILRDKRLRECDYGEMTRHSSFEVENERDSRIEVPFPLGESYMQCAARMKSFLLDLIRDYDDRKVMVIGHRATQYGLEHWINGVDLKKAVTDPWKWQPGWTYHLENLQ